MTAKRRGDGDESDPAVSRTTFDPAEEPVCDVLLGAIADAENAPPEKLPVLAKTLDTDALNAFFRDGPGGPDRAARSLDFTYADYRVSVHSDGVLTVSPL